MAYRTLKSEIGFNVYNQKFILVFISLSKLVSDINILPHIHWLILNPDQMFTVSYRILCRSNYRGM